jgi:hypothetical protein
LRNDFLSKSKDSFIIFMIVMLSLLDYDLFISHV